MTETAAGGSVRAAISGEVSGQIAVGNNIVQNNVAHGGLVYMAAPGERPLVRERRKPVYLRGRRPRELAGRKAEVDAALGAVRSGEPVQFYGPPGAGKTALLKHLAHNLTAEAEPDGIVYHGAALEPIGDSLQFLFEAFCETDVPFKPTDAQIRHHLQQTRALVLLDDVSATRDQVVSLLDALPEAGFVLAGTERVLWNDGMAVPLRGLPEDSALALMEREVGRPLETAEREAAGSVCRHLEGHPLKLLQACAVVVEQQATLEDVARELEAGSPVEALGQRLAASLGSDERKVAVLLGTLGAPLSAEHVQALTGVDDASGTIASLLERAVVQANSPRYTLRMPTPDEDDDRDGEAFARAARYFMDWCNRHSDEPEIIARDGAAIVAVMRGVSAVRRWEEVVRLGRSAQNALMLRARWGLWEQALDLVLQAARALGDRRQEAWCLHQLGTRALCLGDSARDRPLLVAALRLREALGDRDGAAATRHNLDFMSGPPDGGEQPEPPAAPKPSRWVRVGVLIPLLVILGAVWSLRSGQPSGGPLALETETRSATSDANGDEGREDDGDEEVMPARIALIALPTTVDFGSHLLGRSSRPELVTVTNDGTGETKVDSVGLSGSHAADFSIADDRCRNAVLGPEASCEIAIVFSPTRPLGSRAALMVTHSSSGAGTTSVGLSGVGQAVADLEIELSPAGQLATVSNNGPSDARRIEFTIEGRKALLSPSAAGAGACRGGGSSIACSIGSLPAGTSVEAPMVVEWYEGWEIAAQVRGGPHDPDKTNNFDLVRDSGDSNPIPYTGGLVLPQVGGAQVAQNKASRAHCVDPVDDGVGPLDEGCDGALPLTGADLAALIAAAFSAIGVGAALVMVARRAKERRKESA
jgi:hypothetical protein